MTDSEKDIYLPDFIVKWVDVGIFVVNREMEITLWNNFMINYSGHSATDVVGKNLFECFPELPKAWLSKKINSVFILKNFAFTSWEQRPYLFRFPHNRPITGGVDFMYQNCTFLPVKNAQGEVESVCVTLFDATDVGMSQSLLKQALDSLSESSNRDGLTGIYNRRYLEQTLSTEFERSQRYGGDFSFIIFDLDFFKKVNDTYGHLGGDDVLVGVSQRVGQLLRATDVLGRYGGEEFAILLPSTDMEGAKILAERIRKAVAETPIMFKETPIPVSISIGLSQAMPEMPNYEQMIHGADMALYASKRAGRNCVTPYSPELESGPQGH
jgi:diguanylate cyclase (GGDEF)-like protein